MTSTQQPESTDPTTPAWQRRAAAEILRDSTQDIDFSSISEAVTDMVGTLPETELDTLCEAVDALCQRATVLITWPDEPDENDLTAQLGTATAALTAEHVTPLPWTANANYIYQVNEATLSGWGVRVAATNENDVARGDADAALIAAAVNLLPNLVAELSRLQAAEDRYRTAIEQVGDQLSCDDATQWAADALHDALIDPAELRMLQADQ